MTQANPFIQDMVRMQLPANGGSCVAYGGFTLEVDEDNCVTVPKGAIEAMQSHGLTVYGSPEKPAKEPKEPKGKKADDEGKKAE